MSDELLRNVHPFQKLLEETVSKTLLNGGDVLLHVLQTPGDGEKSESKFKLKQQTERERDEQNWASL